MKRKYFLVVLFLMLAMLFIINTSSVNANMYKILDSEGNIIRITNNPVLSIKEIEAGCKILSAPEGITMPTQDKITNGQENKQETSSGSEKYDFRKTNWGMSKEQVKATENKKPDLEEDVTLYYKKVKFNEKDCSCIYFFLKDKLFKSAYKFTGEHASKNLYIDDYEKIKESLTKKYGKPIDDLIAWKNNLYKSNKQEWGIALGSGYLSFVSTWETSTTTIGLALWGNSNLNIYLVLGYDSKELKEWSEHFSGGYAD